MPALFGVERERGSISPLATETIGNAATILWLLLAAVGLVLVVACANVALLSLIRGLDRREETAVWPALTTDLPRLNEVAFDLRALAFIAAVTALSAMLSGLPHAWRRTRVASVARLSASTLRTTAGRDRHRLRDAIVVVQVAMAVVLTTGAGLLIRSFLHLRGTDPGFDPRGVLVAPISSTARPTTAAKRRAPMRLSAWWAMSDFVARAASRSKKSTYRMPSART